jgi:hypothetical protein
VKSTCGFSIKILSHFFSMVHTIIWQSIFAIEKEGSLYHSDQIEEWMREVEERPASAPLIIRFVANRLRDLTSRNEALLAENIELRSGQKVEAYEARIGNLEYQLEMLKRQMQGVAFASESLNAAKMLSLILYERQGRVLRMEFLVSDLADGALVGHAELPETTPGLAPRMLITSPMEELLFVFDSGRTQAYPVRDIPIWEENGAVPAKGWDDAFLVEPRGGEELVTVLAIGKMALFDFCTQTSRRGCAKKMMRTSFESHVAKNFVGSGVKQRPDRTEGLVLCGKDDVLAIASREGFIVSVGLNDLSFSAEEMLRLSATDHITSSFALGQKSTLMVMIQSGKAVVREVSWLERTTTGKGRGQAIFSQARRDAGTRVAGAAAFDEGDWCAVLLEDGRVLVYPVSAVAAAGGIPGGDSGPVVVDFRVFPVSDQTNG